jgi:hypothetical protein
VGRERRKQYNFNGSQIFFLYKFEVQRDAKENEMSMLKDDDDDDDIVCYDAE